MGDDRMRVNMRLLPFLRSLGRVLKHVSELLRAPRQSGGSRVLDAGTPCGQELIIRTSRNRTRLGGLVALSEGSIRDAVGNAPISKCPLGVGGRGAINNDNFRICGVDEWLDVCGNIGARRG
jgi:hypothetical protein